MRYIDADALIKVLKADYEDEGLNVEVTEEKGLIYETRKYSYGQSIYLKAIERVKELPIVDVVPKSEVDRLTNILDSYALQYGTVMDKHIVIEKVRQEVAREIFEEIETVFTVKYPMCTNPVLVLDSLSYAELKKKCTESEGKP